MTRHVRDEPEPPTTHLSAEELRAYLAEARHLDVHTSLATQLFVPGPRAEPEPPTRRRVDLTRRDAAQAFSVSKSGAPETRAHPHNSKRRARHVGEPELTRTCLAIPAFVARPRIGEGEGHAAAASPEPAASGSQTARLTVWERAVSSARLHGPPPSTSTPGKTPATTLRLSGRTWARVARAPRRGLMLSLGAVSAALLTLTLLLTHTNDGAPMATTAAAPPSQTREPPPLPQPSLPLDPEAPATEVSALGAAVEVKVGANVARRAVDLLLAGRSREALDAYRSLALLPGAPPVLAHVVTLLEREAKQCATRGDACP
jgi:hypothetical protein